MKNEEKLLARCLDSVHGVADEIIIVDTGSTDKSVEIAKRYGADVLFEPWKDDFAGPRNKGIEKATKQWILILDPDEVLGAKDKQKLRDLTRATDIVGYRMVTRNYTMDPKMQGIVKNGGEYAEAKGWLGWCPSLKTRLFRNGFGLKFVGRWHELVDISAMLKKLPVGDADVPIHHYAGEMCQESLAEKKEFYLRMGEKKVQDDPTKLNAWWELGVSESIIGYHARAVRSFLKSMEKGFYNADRMLQLYNSMVKAGYAKQAILAHEKALCKMFPNLTHIDVKLKNLDALDPHLDSK